MNSISGLLDTVALDNYIKIRGIHCYTVSVYITELMSQQLSNFRFVTIKYGNVEIQKLQIHSYRGYLIP